LTVESTDRDHRAEGFRGSVREFTSGLVPPDLKGITLLYASDAGKHITGQWLAVDGGLSVVSAG